MKPQYYKQWLVWRSANGVRHINKVKLSRARLVLGLVTTFGGSAIPVFIQVTSGATSTGDGFGHLWEETAHLKL